MHELQKEFISETFFRNNGFAGWKNIADELLENGKCIVAGEDCIWKGGVGNFISTKPVKNSYKCSEYTFHLKEFLSSEYYKQAVEEYKEKIKIEFLKAKEKHEIVKTF